LRQVLHCSANQHFLRPELAEDRDLVYPRGIRDATGGRAAEAMLREDSGSSGEDCVSVIHGQGNQK
jgi:hypothetical protein